MHGSLNGGLPRTTRLTENSRRCKNNSIFLMHADHFYGSLMAQALKEAKKAFSEGEVPVGAVLASPEGEIVAKAHNQTISRSDPTAHAEILVIRRAGEVFKNYRLNHTLLAVTIAPFFKASRVDRAATVDFAFTS